jgi:hypothetical protein
MGAGEPPWPLAIFHARLRSPPSRVAFPLLRLGYKSRTVAAVLLFPFSVFATAA